MVYNYIVGGGRRPRDGKGPASACDNADCIDFDVIEDEGLEWPGTRDEFERWLDAIAPTEEELEHRDRCDAFLGHDD